MDAIVTLAMGPIDRTETWVGPSWWGRPFGQAYGTQLAEHHRRRNRPCTCPNWTKVSMDSSFSLVANTLRSATRVVDGI